MSLRNASYMPRFCTRCGEPLSWWAQVQAFTWCKRCPRGEAMRDQVNRRRRRTRLADIVLPPLEATMTKWPKSARQEVDRLVAEATHFRKERDEVVLENERLRRVIDTSAASDALRPAQKTVAVSNYSLDTEPYVEPPRAPWPRAEGLWFAP